jgi:outer membrane lipoprotein-sorting protein
MSNRLLHVAMFVALTGAALPLGAADDPNVIMGEVQKRSQAQSQQYEGVLKVTDGAGKTSEKGWTYQRTGSNGASKVLIRFTLPAEVKGIALLVVNYPDRSADQWMWTPAINRERRIAAQDRSSRFFGTDFSFEDLEERDVAQFDYVLRGTETIDRDVCWKIAATPRPGMRSQYTTSTYWVRKSNHSYAQIENSNAKGLVRRLKYSQMQNVQGIWTAGTLEVEDVTRKSRTTLTLRSIKYNAPLPADLFTVQALRRAS